MYCPNCGTQTMDDRRFCRSCGMDLQTLSNVLTGKLQVVEPGAPAAQEGQGIDRRRKVLNWGFITLWGGIILGILLVIIGEALRNFSMAAGRFIGDLGQLGALVMLIGVGIMIFSRLLPKSEPPQKPAQPLAFPVSRQPFKVEPEYRIPISSVTENTTELLKDAEAPPRPRDTAGRLE